MEALGWPLLEQDAQVDRSSELFLGAYNESMHFYSICESTVELVFLVTKLAF